MVHACADERLTRELQPSNLSLRCPPRARIRLVPTVVVSAIAAFTSLATSSPAEAGGAGPVLQSDSESAPDLVRPWSQAAFDAAHTAFNRFEDILSPSNVGLLTQAWASPVGVGTLYASPIVSGGRVYIGSGDGHMFAFDARTGATVWVGQKEKLFFVDSAAARHGLVFANALYQPLRAYDAQTGAIVWTSSFSDVRASPTIVGRVLYVASFDGTLAAIDQATGAARWSVQGGCCVYDQAPVVDGGKVFQMRTDHTLTAYDAMDGTQLWSVPAFSVGTVAAWHGKVFFNDYPNIVALDEATGAQVWAAPVLTAATGGAPAVADGMVFVTQSQLLALDAATGAVVWTAPASSGWGPVVANGVVYASSLSGEWDAFDEHDGSLLWSVTVGSGCGGSCANATPVVADGTLYLAGPDQYLRAFTLPQ